MRIKVKADGVHLNIPIPIGFFLNGFTAGIICSELKKHGDFPVSEEQLRVLLRELKRAKKTFSKLPLVDVQSADGQRVLITL